MPCHSNRLFDADNPHLPPRFCHVVANQSVLVIKIAHLVLGEELGYSLTKQSEKVVLLIFYWAWAFEGKRERNSREAYPGVTTNDPLET